MKVSLNDQADGRSNGVSPGQTLIVHDGLYSNPHAMRGRGLTSKYGPREQGSYPGRNASERVMDPETIALFRHLVGAPIVIRPTDAFGVFRVSQLDDPFVNFIHADPVRWGGVAYLNLPEHSLGGTAFWRHRETGLEQHPFDDWAKYGFRSEAEAWRTLVQKDGIEEDKWELTLFVPARFNRLILFNSRLYHSHMPRRSFGDTLETARLVQVFFFEEAAQSE